MKRTFLHSVIAAVLVTLAATAVQAADIAVIVNKNNGNDVSREMVEKIYKGELTLWPGGGAVVPYDLADSSPERAAFTSQLLGKTVAAMKAVWSIKLFSGKGTPPKMLDSDEEVRNAVANNKNAIGYVKASSANGSVKVVLTLR